METGTASISELRASQSQLLACLWIQDSLVDAGSQFGDPFLHQIINRKCIPFSKRTPPPKNLYPKLSKSTDSDDGLSLLVTLQRTGKSSHL